MAEPGFRELFSRYLAGDTNDAETQQVLEQIAAGTDDQELNAWIAAYWEQLEKADSRYTPETGRPILNRILDAPESTITRTVPPVNKIPDSTLTSSLPRIRFLRKWPLVAASIALVLGIGAYLWMSSKKTSGPATAAVDIQPGKEGAILTLADGSTVLLDTIQNGVISLQGGATAKVVNGTLFYEGSGNEVVYNIMSIPKGRQFHITLPDGTQVWLNSASSIRYPTAFIGDERRVEITGEAYFEVARNKKKPFRVSVNNKAELEVLGTHFNVNAYDDEQNIAATLLEGSVAVASSDHSVVLKPGQQAQVTKDMKNDINVANADVDKVMAWKNGLFNFEDASLEQVMRQLSRWYDIEVIYEKGIPEIYFVGEMGRNMPLIDVLASLETTGVRFRLEGRKLIVLPL